MVNFVQTLTAIPSNLQVHVNLKIIKFKKADSKIALQGFKETETKS